MLEQVVAAVDFWQDLRRHEALLCQDTQLQVIGQGEVDLVRLLELLDCLLKLAEASYAKAAALGAIRALTLWRMALDRSVRWRGL